MVFTALLIESMELRRSLTPLNLCMSGGVPYYFHVVGRGIDYNVSEKCFDSLWEVDDVFDWATGLIPVESFY